MACVVLAAAALFLSVSPSVSASASVQAAPPRQAPPARQPLPAFSVMDAAGVAVESVALPIDGPWLLLYVGPVCQPCDAALTRIAARPDVAPRLVVIVRAEPAAVQAMRAQYPSLAAARWYADPSRAAWRALSLSSLPTLVGWRSADEAWRFAGGPRDQASFESLVRSWVIR